MDRKSIENKLPKVALVAACILGLSIRFYPVMQYQLPLNDGSLFVQMAEDLLAAGFSLPDVTSYNLSQIPFAYPPLGIYLAALLARFSPLDSLTIIRFLPAFISGLTIPLFYLLAKQLLNSSREISIAVLIYALIPRSWLWFVMGGGITRAPGMLFSILTIYAGCRLFTQRKGLVTAIICFSLTVLSHPEAAVFVALALGVLFLAYDRGTAGLRSLALIALGSAVITTPWWLAVVLRHGFEPFLAAARTSGAGVSFFDKLVLLDLTGEPALTIFTALALVGGFYCLAKKDYFAPLLLGLTIILLPNGGPNFLSPIVALLCAHAISHVILPGISAVKTKISGDPAAPAGKFPLVSAVFLAFLTLHLFTSAYLAARGKDTPLRAISPEEQTAMQWVRSNTAAGDKFLLLWEADWREDYLGEWFPYLTQRHAVNTLTGAEWLPGGRFQYIDAFRNHARECLNQSLLCLKQIQTSYNFSYDYLYLVRQTQSNPYANTLGLEFELLNHPDFVLVYDGPAGLVYAYQP